jgi:fatty acid desaturase
MVRLSCVGIWRRHLKRLRWQFVASAKKKIPDGACAYLAKADALAVGLTVAARRNRLDLAPQQRKALDMKALRVLAATLGLLALAAAWYLSHVPTLLAIGTAAALLVWGLDLDWRRKARVARASAQSKERRLRRAVQQKIRSERGP